MEDYEDIEQFEDFESFKKKVSPVTLKTMDDDFYDDLNTDELKSKEILGSINLSNSFLQKICSITVHWKIEFLKRNTPDGKTRIFLQVGFRIFIPPGG